MPGTVTLPMEGYAGDIPEWPLDSVSEGELKRWERVWRCPMAAQWIRMHIDLVVARYVRVTLQVEEGNDSITVAGSNLHSEARQLEDRLGLSPLALLRLRWEIAPAEKAEVTPIKERSTRRLKAVDHSAVAGS